MKAKQKTEEFSTKLALESHRLHIDAALTKFNDLKVLFYKERIKAEEKLKAAKEILSERGMHLTHAKDKAVERKTFLNKEIDRVTVCQNQAAKNFRKLNDSEVIVLNRIRS